MLNLTYMREIGDSKEEANSVKNIGLSGAIESSNGIKGGIESFNDSALPVGFEAINYHRLNIHYVSFSVFFVSYLWMSMISNSN